MRSAGPPRLGACHNTGLRWISGGARPDGGLASLRNTPASLQNAPAALQNGPTSLQNTLATLQNGLASPRTVVPRGAPGCPGHPLT